MFEFGPTGTADVNTSDAVIGVPSNEIFCGTIELKLTVSSNVKIICSEVRLRVKFLSMGLETSAM